MKKALLTLSAILFGFSQTNAQQIFTSDLDILKVNQGYNNFWDQTSFELSYGYAMPMSPTTNITASDYSSFLNFQIGANYQFDELFGIRLTYAHHSFENKDHSKVGVNYNKLMAEATFKIMSAITYNNQSPFDIIAHAGIGGTFAKSKWNDNNEKMLNLQFGLKPTYSLNDRLNIFLDVTTTANFKQDFGYNGLAITPNGDGHTGAYTSAMIGVQVRFGQ